MHVGQFENLLPDLSSRMVTFGQTPQGGHVARFDNGVYFHPVRMGSYFVWNNVMQLHFYLFFNPDGSHAAPGFDALGTLLTGYLKDGVYVLRARHDSAVRANLLRVRDEFSLGRLTVVCRTKDPVHVPSVVPGVFSEAWSVLLPSRRRGPDGYNWPDVATSIVRSLDTVLQLLVAAGPTQRPKAAEPR